MKLSLRTAAEQAGVSKTTILRAIRSGRLSAPRNDDGGYAIDPAELFRVYPLGGGPADHEDPDGPRTVDQDATLKGPAGPAESTARTAALEAEVVGLKELVRRMDLAAADLRSDRDAWRSQAEQAQRLLSVAQAASTQAPRSMWARWFGKM